MGKFSRKKGHFTVSKTDANGGAFSMKRIPHFAALPVLFAILLSLTACNVFFHELAAKDPADKYIYVTIDFNVKFVADGANGYPQTRTVRKGDSAGPMPEPLPEKTGFIFVVWLDEQRNPFSGQQPVTSDMIITAEWYDLQPDENGKLPPPPTINDVESHWVTFKTNDGTPEIKRLVLHGNVIIYIPTVSREGYTFGGWYTDESYNSQYDFNRQVYEDLILFAKWTPVNNNSDTTISLNQTTLNLNRTDSTPNPTATLTATVVSSESVTVTWLSSVPGVATVSDNDMTCTVTAYANGSTVITATTSDGKTAQCTVTVTSTATTISLSENTLTLYRTSTPNPTATLTATVVSADPTVTVEWSSSNETVATVTPTTSTSVTVTGISRGTAVITATTSDSASTTCTVNVVQKVTGVIRNAVTLPDLEIAQPPGSGTYVTLTDYFTVQPTDANEQGLLFSITSQTPEGHTGNVVNITDNTATANGKGTAVITATSSDNSAISADITLTVIQLPTSITLNDTGTLTLEIWGAGSGTEGTRTATVLPENANNKNVTWSIFSQNKVGHAGDVVQVNYSTGEVTAMGRGTATIRASTINGFTAEYEVEVIQHATGIGGNKGPNFISETLPNYALMLVTECYLEIKFIPGNTNATTNLFDVEVEDLLNMEYTVEDEKISFKVINPDSIGQIRFISASSIEDDNLFVYNESLFIEWLPDD